MATRDLELSNSDLESTEKKEKNKMSVFGNLDINEISDNPFETANDTYWCVIIESKIVTVEKEDGYKALAFTWSIDEPEGKKSEFHKNRIQEFYRLLPENDKREWSELTSDEMKTLKKLKLRLRRGFDMTPQEMDISSEELADKLLGMEAYVTTTTGKGTGVNEGKTYTNASAVVCKRIYEEENGKLSESLGLSSLGEF